jgi:hypothetical protein
MSKTIPTTQFIDLPKSDKDSLLLVVETFMMKNPFFYGKMKYEDALVTFLELFEQGFLKFHVDEDMTVFTLLLYDPVLDDYVKPQDSAIARFLGRDENDGRSSNPQNR